MKEPTMKTRPHLRGKPANRCMGCERPSHTLYCDECVTGIPDRRDPTIGALRESLKCEIRPSGQRYLPDR